MRRQGARHTPPQLRGLAATMAMATVSAWLLAALPSPVAQARHRDPTEPQTLVTSGATVVASRLPAELTLWWQTRVPGVVTRAPVVDAKGTLVVAFAGGLSELSSDGERLVTRTLPGMTPASSPVLSFDGTRLFVTADAELIALWPDGRWRTRRELGLDPATLLQRPHLTRDDTLLVGAAGLLLELTPDGNEVARTSLDGTPVAVLAQPRGHLIITSAGEVFDWQTPSAPRHRASFGGAVQPDVTLTPGGELLAVTGGSRIVSLRIADGARRTITGDVGTTFLRAPLLTPSGETRTLTADGFLLGHDRGGGETTRVRVDDAGSAPVFRRVGGTEPLPPAPVMDHQGRVAVVWPGASPIVIDRSDRPRAAEAGGCDAPIGLLTLPPRTVVVTCASGLVTRLGPRTR